MKAGYPLLLIEYLVMKYGSELDISKDFTIFWIFEQCSYERKEWMHYYNTAFWQSE